jgi:hypothetical protein
MALVVYDRVQQTGTANTTVSFTLSATTTGYQSFAVIGNGNTTYYSANDGTNWETGIGTYSTTGPTLTRTTVLASSNSGSAVTFSGTVTVFCDYLAGKAVYQDSLNTAYAPQLGASNGIVINNKTVGASYSIPSGYSAMSAGPITVASGQTVTVASGSRWVVL